MKATFRGVFERIEDRAHCRIRLVAKISQATRALMRPCHGCTSGATCSSLPSCIDAALKRAEIVVGHTERTLFYAREPQAPVTDEEMRFGIWLGAWAEDAAKYTMPKEFEHWRQFYETRIYGPTVEVIEEPA